MIRRSALGALIALAVRQHRARPVRSLVAAAGVALATLVVGGALGGGLVTEDLSQRDRLAALPETSRAFQVTMLGTALQDGLDAPDRAARAALAQLVPTPATRSVVLRETNLAGRGVVLAAVDGVGRWVALDSGRLPGDCTAARCEVVQVAGAPARPAPVPGANLVVVGTGRVTSPLPFGRDRLRGNVPLFVASDTAALTALPVVAFVYRVTIWSAPLAPGALHAWEVPQLLSRTAAAARAVEAVAASDLQLTGPTREITAARTSGRAAGRRLGLLGATGVALVLAFAALVASMLRRDLDDDRARLSRRGATRRQLMVFVMVDRAWISLIGTLAGAAAAIGAIAMIALSTGRPVVDLLRHSLVSGRGAALVVGLWLLCTLILTLAGSGPPDGLSVGPVRLADIVIVAAVGAAALAASRGTASAADLAAGSFDPLPVALPILVCLIAGAGALRLTGPLVRWCERRFAASASLPIRLALIGQSRRPRRLAMSVAFVVVGVGLAIFATGYAATLAAGQRDQAAFAVPLDATVTAGPDLVSPLDRAPLERYAALGSKAVPILRSPVSIAGVRSQLIDATLLGVPASLVARFPRWRGDTSTSNRAALAAALETSSPEPLGSIAIPADATAVTVQTTRTGSPVDLSLVARAGGGTARQIALGGIPSGTGTLSAPIPTALRGGAILALRLGLSAAQQINTGHAEAEGRGGDVLAGTLRVTAIEADTPAGRVTLPGIDGWVGRGAAASAGPTGVGRWTYTLAAGREAVIRAPHPSDTEPVPLIVSEDIAQAAGRDTELTIVAGAGRRLRGRIAATATRFPTIGTGSFAVADQARLAAALDAADPGAGTPREVWVGRGSGQDAAAFAAGFARPPLTSLNVRSRADELALRRSDARARGVLWTLWAIVAAALLLSVVAVGLGTATDIRDERAELSDLDAQGLPRATLRHHLRMRGVVPIALGVLGGVVLGIGLVTLVVRLVLVTATADAPVPPLARISDWPRVAWLLAAFAVAALATVAVVAARSLRTVTVNGGSR